MFPFSLLKKELLWIRRNLFLLFFLLVLVPLFFAGAGLIFQDVIPRNVPVAVVAEDETVTDEDLEIVAGTIDSVTRPRVVDSRQEARRLLERETVYGIVTVPPDITADDGSVTVGFTVDGNVVPFLEPSEVISRLIQFQLDQLLDAEVTTDRSVAGDVRDLPEFLYPALLVAVTIFVAFTYVPLVFQREAAVLDRVRVESSLEAVVAAKLTVLTGLMVVPISAFHLVSWFSGYDLDSLAPGAVLVVLLTFVMLAAVSTTVMVLARFSDAGRFVNLIVMLGLLALSALAFPLGFFSTIRTTVAQFLPTYYASVVVRSLVLKGSSLSTFLDWLGLLVGLTLLSILVLEGAVIRYRRTS